MYVAISVWLCLALQALASAWLWLSLWVSVCSTSTTKS